MYLRLSACILYSACAVHYKMHLSCKSIHHWLITNNNIMIFPQEIYINSKPEYRRHSFEFNAF